MKDMLSVRERRAERIAMVIARLALAYLFFGQLFWKLPPSFGCPPDFAFTTGGVKDGYVQLQRTSGLCDWMGVEQVWARQPRPFLVTDLGPLGGPRLSVDIAPLALLNGWLIDVFFQPAIRFTGWLVFLAEAWVALSLFLGLFSRLGGLVSLGVSAQLMVGLAGISNPPEWEWSYILLVVLSLLMMAQAPGRVFGLDALLRPRLATAAGGGNRWARLLLRLT